MDTRLLRFIGVWVGLIIFGVGAIFAFTNVHRDGYNCGSVIYNKDLADPGCDSAISDRKPIAFSLLIVGGVVGAGCGWIEYGERSARAAFHESEEDDDDVRPSP